MRVTVTQVISPEVCVFSMNPGSAKRLPLDMGRPLHCYYLTCPTCGMPNAANVTGDGQQFVEEGRLVAMTPGIRCNACKRLLVIRDGAFEVDDAT